MSEPVFVELDLKSTAPIRPTTIYVLHGGPVVNKNLGGIFMMRAEELLALYKIDPYYAVVEQEVTGGLMWAVARGEVRLVHLHPDHTNKWELP